MLQLKFKGHISRQRLVFSQESIAMITLPASKLGVNPLLSKYKRRRHGREAWTKGVSRKTAKALAMEEAFSLSFRCLQARIADHEKQAIATERKRAIERAAVCSTVWDAARYGVPVRQLRELMEQKLENSRFVIRLFSADHMH